MSEEIDYRPPPAKALERGKGDKGPDPRDQEITGRKLVETLGHFGVEAKIVGVVSGPHVSRYELRLAPGIKVKKVTELANDLAYALASTDIRILAPIPGKQAVGVEVPNARRRMVRLGDIYAGRPEKTSPLVAWLGKGIDGNPVWTDLAKMPHVLVAGTTGSGKCGCVNAILSSILMQASPNEVRLVLVDPKQVELNHYENVPHLLTPVVTSPRLAANVLSNLIGEMETRYGIMSEARCRNLVELNRNRQKKGEAPLPHILCVIDELADLMMVAPAEVEDSIIRLAQKSRATGIHLVLATQRPSTDIITGTIKVNIPSRIAFAVSSQTDSRVILDQGGAESLLGQGDMLFRGAGSSKLQRVQGAFITEDEIARITNHWARQGEPEFEAELLETPEEAVEEGAATATSTPTATTCSTRRSGSSSQTETASVSMIQRRLRVGYTRAGRLIDMLERRGVISGYEGSKPRQVLITQADLNRVLAPAGQGRGRPTPSRRSTSIPSLTRPAGPWLAAASGSFSRVIRAGIVVTGTEVITGRISDSNGPWVSEQLAELGVEVAHILVVADRPDDLEAALRFLAAEGMDLIVTSGGLGPTADDLTAEVVGRFAGRELVLDEAMEEKIAEILRGFAKRGGFDFDEEAMMEANRKQAMVPEGAIALDPVGTAPGLVVPAGERVVIVLPGPPRELQPMWPAALETEPVREVLDRATPLRGYTLRMFGVPESEIAKSLREIEGDGVDDRRGRDHHLPAPRRDRDRRPLPRRGGGGRRRGARRASASATSATSSASTARRSTRRWRNCCEGGGWAWPSPAAAACWRRGSPTCPGASEYLAGSVVAYSNEAKDGAARRRPGADRGARARSRRRSPRRWRSGRWSASGPTSRSRSPASPGPTAAPRRSRSATSASTPASPTAPRSPATRSSPAAASDIRERSALVGDAPAADPARRRRAAALGAISRSSRASRRRLVAKAP